MIVYVSVDECKFTKGFVMAQKVPKKVSVEIKQYS